MSRRVTDKMYAPSPFDFVELVSLPALIAAVAIAWALGRWVVPQVVNNVGNNDFWVRVYEGLTNRTIRR